MMCSAPLIKSVKWQQFQKFGAELFGFTDAWLSAFVQYGSQAAGSCRICPNILEGKEDRYGIV